MTLIVHYVYILKYVHYHNRMKQPRTATFNPDLNFEEQLTSVIEELFANCDKLIFGFREKTVMAMTHYWKILFLQHVKADQDNPRNPREVSKENLKVIAEMLRYIEGYEKNFMLPREQGKQFPLWKAEVARKGIVKALTECLLFMRSFNINTIMQMLGVDFNAAKKYAKQLCNAGKAVIKSWNHHEPEKTHITLHPSIA